jgi:type II secretory pathway component GspD/PulD (secretin)
MQPKKFMNAKKIILGVAFGLAMCQLALCQANDTAAPAATNSPNMASNHQAGQVAPANDTAAAPPDTNVIAGDESGNGSLSATNAAPAETNMAEAIIPLIQFSDVPITTAIQNLARQANINYLMDPKIGYGQPEANGQIKPEPTLSVRWENITAKQALIALLDNYGLQLIQDPKTKIARITPINPAAPPPLFTRVIQLKYASVSNMVQSVEATLTDKRSRVLGDTRTSQMIVVATEPEQDAVDTLVAQLDKPTRQVLIETKLVEISSNPTTSKGIDWSGTLAAQNISFGNGVLNSAASGSTASIPGASTTSTFGGHSITTTPGASQSTTLSVTPQSSTSPGGFTLNTASGLTPDIGFLSADGVHAVLSFLNSSSEAQVMSTPRVVTLDNETATISVTRAFPIINVTAGTQNTAGGSQITYTNIGTILEVTPRISANDYIWLKVIPEVSSYFQTVSKTIDGETYQADEFDNRRIQTQVLIPDAHTLVMGGMVNDDPSTHDTKVPILGDIPILGYAFRSENQTLEKDNLLIFITPTILQASDFEPTTTKFLSSKPITMQPPLDFNNPMNSTTPRDWSNPLSASSPSGKTSTTTDSATGNSDDGEFDNVPAPTQPAN